MANRSNSSPLIVLALGAAALLLASCYTGPAPDPYGPRSGDGLLVDPRTGIMLPGQDDLGSP